MLLRVGTHGQGDFKMTTTPPNPNALAAAFRAGRKALDDYSAFDSSMVPDDALEVFVTDVINGYLAALPPPKGVS